LGIFSYIDLPKEQFPDIVIPTIFVQTVYPGTSPQDIETLITRPIEKQLKSVNGVKKVTSQSMPDVSVIIVEFHTDVETVTAKQRVQDAVDKAKSELPTDLDTDPSVQEIDFSEFPIMFVNIAGDVEPQRLKAYADDLKDRIEAMKEIRRADIIGGLEREIHVDLDLYKMQAASLTFDDVKNAIRGENVNISCGEFTAGGVRRNIRLISEFKTIDDIKNIFIKTGTGSMVYLRDIADIRDGFKEKQSYARMNGKPVISLSVIKRSGENLIEASDKIKKLIADFKDNYLPQNVDIKITSDRSISTKRNLDDLINTVVIGFILVTVILMFFMGVQDAMFVALAVPLSSFIAFMIMPPLDFSFNTIVTFSFLMALGIIVDDAIVVIENTHRLYTKENIPIRKASKMAAGEVFVPVLAGTLTTIAPFIPLIWIPGIVGEFIYYLPVVLLITLSASLFVAFFINPVLASDFMRKHSFERTKEKDKKFHKIFLSIFALGVLFDVASMYFFGNLFITLAVLGYLNHYFITPVLIKKFQQKLLPKIMDLYKKTILFFLQGRRPYFVFAGMIVLFIFSIFLFAMFPPKINFFPSGDPNFIYTYVKTPIGTDAAVTDSVVKEVEKEIYKIIGRNNPIVKSVISNIGIGAGDPMNPDRAVTPHKGKVTVAFVEYGKRNGVSTSKYLEEIRKNLRLYPGVEISVEQERMGPPTGKPVSIEISGDNIDTLLAIEKRLRTAIAADGIEGIEQLQRDLNINKPEIMLLVNRARANYYGVKSGQIGSALRTANFGLEVSKFRDDKDDYPIIIRLEEKFRNDLNTLLNMPITYREMSTGRFRQIPISAMADIRYSYSYASINRKNQKRTIMLTSNVLKGFNANEINKQIEALVPMIDLPDGYEVKFSGMQEDQKEIMDFMIKAFFIAVFLVLLIMVTQFNSMVKPLIIITQIILSTIGVFLGFLIFRFEMSVALTGIGVVALAGIVVKNGIVLMDFIELLLQKRGRIRAAIAESGAIRFNPVILTAVSTVLGLIPLAIGFNINFETLFTEFNPHIYIGGDSVAFWGPLAWAIIFGLSFATFLTLIVVPCMYFIQYDIRVRAKRKRELKKFARMRKNAAK
jgi:multidrug efflux pump subunit AcrB